MSRNLRIDDFDLPADCDAGVLSAIEYWTTISPSGALPGRQHFDPTDIPNLLSGVWLLDVEQHPLRFVFRLVGTGIVEFFGDDPTGRDLCEVFERFDETIAYRDLAMVAREGEPRWRRGTPVLSNDGTVDRLERVYLPCARDGTTVDMVFCYTAFSSPQRQ